MSVRHFLHELHEWQSLAGAVIGAATATVIAVLVTKRITTAAKRTDLFLDFTKRYHAIRVEMHKLDTSFNRKRQLHSGHRPDPFEQGDAHQIYFQLFGLVYDEYFAFQAGFLDEKIFADWITWQMCEAKEDKEIGGVPFRDAWKTWSSLPVVEVNRGTKFMNEVRACLMLPEIERNSGHDYVEPLARCIQWIVLRNSPSCWRRLYGRLAKRSTFVPTGITLGTQPTPTRPNPV